MEPHTTMAHLEGDRLTLWDESQWVGNVRDAIALAFGIPSDGVRVINPFVSGAFGSALRHWPHMTLAALRSVRPELTWRQLYQSVSFRPRTEQRVALGADRDGRLAALVQEAVGEASTHKELAEAAGTWGDRVRRYRRT